MDISRFKTPDSLEEYGDIIQAFNLAMKTLAEIMVEHKITDSTQRILAGFGEYNSYRVNVPGRGFNPNNFVRLGEKKMAQFKNEDRSGLFGMFKVVHDPQLKLAQQFLVLMGREGFVLRVDDKEISLDRVHLDFMAAQGDRRGIIVLENKVDDLPPGMELFMGRNGDPVSTDRSIAILDADRKELAPRTAAAVCWLHVSAVHGLKKQGNPERLRTLVIDGFDDDFNAQRGLIETLQALKETHAFDVMPQFQQFLLHTKQELQKNLNQECLKAVCVLAELLAGCKGDEHKQLRDYIGRVIAFFDITLPSELSADYKHPVSEVIVGVLAPGISERKGPNLLTLPEALVAAGMNPASPGYCGPENALQLYRQMLVAEKLPLIRKLEPFWNDVAQLSPNRVREAGLQWNIDEERLKTLSRRLAGGTAFSDPNEALAEMHAIKSSFSLFFSQDVKQTIPGRGEDKTEYNRGSQYIRAYKRFRNTWERRGGVQEKLNQLIEALESCQGLSLDLSGSNQGTGTPGKDVWSPLSTLRAQQSISTLNR